MSLQEDEIQLTNSVFKKIYDNLIEYFHTHEIFLIEQYLQQLSPEMANEVTSILMNEEREALHNWEAKQIFVKQKNQTIAQYTTETILTLRWYLVNQLIDDLKNTITPESEDSHQVLEDVRDYLTLTNVFSKNLGRVISRHS